MSFGTVAASRGVSSQVHMVGHQSVGMERAAAFVERLAQPVQVSGVVLLAEEAGLAVVPTLHNVQGNTGQMNAGASWHARGLL